MGIQDLQAFLDGNCVQGGAVPVDLLKIARHVMLRQRSRMGKSQQQQHNSAILRLVLDGECCLDRLYGGYFSGEFFNYSRPVNNVSRGQCWARWQRY